MSDPWTWHGGGLVAAQRRFGGGEWIDLSTGINPHPWPDAAKLDCNWQRLPDPEGLAELEVVAAAYFGADQRHVCAVPGSEIGLRLIGALIGGPAQHVAPGYRTHSAMITGSTATAFATVRDGRGALILANPNNPDGENRDAAAMHKLLARRDGWLLVDEAFADADPAASLAAMVSDEERLVVFRSFGKFFGLAGVRLGFVVAPQAMVAGLRQMLGAWPLSAAAIAIGTAAYRDHNWIAAARERLPREATRLDATLIRRGHRPIGACPLFRLIEVNDARALFERLAQRAILTRPFADQPHRLRIGLPADADALARLDAALTDG